MLSYTPRAGDTMSTIRLLLLTAVLGWATASAMEVICYSGTWTHYRNGEGRLDSLQER